MGTDESEARKRAWKNYWSSGLLHSCADSSGRNYAGAIGEFWVRRFSTLGPGSQVLDLATGNGALPQLLHEQLDGNCEIDAVDQAELSPRWHAPSAQPNIRFHPNVSIESLPFADAAFDAVVSQFGFEYAHRETAVRECMRVMRRDATLAFVMHHADSVLVQVGREELRHHELLAGDHGLLRMAIEVVPWMARVRRGERPDAQADAARERYNLALQNLAEAASGSNTPDLLHDARTTVHRLLSCVAADPAPVSSALCAYAEMLQHARLRTAEMIACALDAAGIANLVSIIHSQLPTKQIRTSVLRQHEGVVAWTLEVT